MVTKADKILIERERRKKMPLNRGDESEQAFNHMQIQLGQVSLIWLILKVSLPTKETVTKLCTVLWGTTNPVILL